VDDISIHDVQIALISLSTPHAKNLKGNVVVELNTKESASLNYNFFSEHLRAGLSANTTVAWSLGFHVRRLEVSVFVPVGRR
jgi:hypothetical protein